MACPYCLEDVTGKLLSRTPRPEVFCPHCRCAFAADQGRQTAAALARARELALRSDAHGLVWPTCPSSAPTEVRPEPPFARVDLTRSSPRLEAAGGPGSEGPRHAAGASAAPQGRRDSFRAALPGRRRAATGL